MLTRLLKFTRWKTIWQDNASTYSGDKYRRLHGQLGRKRRSKGPPRSGVKREERIARIVFFCIEPINSDQSDEGKGDRISG